MNGQEAILKATHKRAERAVTIYERYRKTQPDPMLLSSAIVCLSKLVTKGCAERPIDGRYRATGKPYYRKQGVMPESIYITAIRESGGVGVSPTKIMLYLYRKADEFNRNLKPDQTERVKPKMITALTYLSSLKAQGRITQDEDGNFGLVKGGGE
jgi:hypothetical protein